ncbi:peroxiredoxin prx5 [Penicillium frequentans]|nr:peroxiredoxin prx5 [Penicillium glabrum]
MTEDNEKDAANSPTAVSGPSSLPSDHEEVEPPVVAFKTWIVALILSCGYGLSFWPIPVVSAIGSSVSADLGDANGYVWFVPAWTISITCSFLLFGPNTDLLGRRWFLVMGNLVTFAGHIIIASAKNTNQIIAGLAVSGFGGANCQMAAFALPELLPNKWRHIGVVFADMTVYVAVIVAPVTARFGYEMNTWQWNFWGVAIFQGLSFVGLLLLYHPPKHPIGISYMEAFKSMDYLGGFLFIGGIVPFLMGIVWASSYSSTDPHVVATLVVGAVVLVLFALWETYGNLKYPLTPTAIFTSSYGRDFTAPVIALGVINMFYYSSSILWPQMITVFYTNGGEDWKYAVVLSLPQGLGILFGALLLTFLGSYIRHWQWQLTISVFVMVLFGSLLGLVSPHNKGMMIAFLFLSQVGFGWAIYLSIAITQMGVEQQNLGVSGGISGCIRFAAGAVATTIYETVYSKTLTKYMEKFIPAAVTAAGLSEPKVEGLMSVVSGGASALTSYSPAVAAAAEAALSDAYCKAIFVVAMVSMAFGIVGLIACLCCKDVDSKMTNKIEVYLENTSLAERNTFH